VADLKNERQTTFLKTIDITEKISRNNPEQLDTVKYMGFIDL
jgi:hypothetical protein